MAYEDTLLQFARMMRDMEADVARRMREQQKGELFKDLDKGDEHAAHH